MSARKEQPSNVAQRVASSALLLIAGVALIAAWNTGQSKPGIDYYQFWVGGEAIEHDAVTNPYRDFERARMGALYLERSARQAASPRQHQAASRRPVLETYSTPFLYAAIHALASGDYDRDFTRWHALSLVGFVAAVVGLARLVGFGWTAALALLATLVAGSAPFQSELQVANVNRVQLAVLALGVALSCRRRDATHNLAAGALFGACAMFKPNVVLVALFVVAVSAARRDWPSVAQQCTGIAAGALLCFAASSFFFGSASCWLDWMTSLQMIPAGIITASLGNYAALVFLFGEQATAYGLPLAIAASVPVGAAIFSGRENEAFDPLRVVTAAGLGCVVFLLTANLVWEHYMLLAIPLLISVLRDASTKQASGWRGWLSLRILPGAALLGVLATPTFGIAGLPHEVYFPVVQGSALMVLYGLGIAQLRGEARRTDS